jgi:hypothetical protein
LAPSFLTHFHQSLSNHTCVPVLRDQSSLIGELDPDDWDSPPKPKWMRWRTYQRCVDRFDRYEDLRDREIGFALARPVRTNFLF